MLANGMSCLHVGMPKTGTTTLQNRVYAGHSQVFYLGKFYHPRPFFLNREVEEIVTQIRDRDLDEQQSQALRSRYERLVAPAREAGKLPLWSDEEATLVPHARLRQRVRAFRGVFGPSKVLITLRDPISCIKSSYLHLLTTYQIDRGRRMMTKGLQRSYSQKPKFLSIEQWMQTLGFEPGDESRFTLANLVDVATVAEIFEECFGRENVEVFLFEQMVQDLPGYVEDVSAFLGIDGEEMLSLIGHHRDARRVSQETVDRLRAICDSPLQMTMFRYGSQWLRNRMTGVDASAGRDARPAQVTIPDDWEERILAVARDSHQRLLRQRSTPLDRYGYPL